MQIGSFSVSTCGRGTAPARAQLASYRRHRLSPASLCKPKGPYGTRTSRHTKPDKPFDFRLSGKLWELGERGFGVRADNSEWSRGTVCGTVCIISDSFVKRVKAGSAGGLGE